jgi:hypothetical protein
MIVENPSHLWRIRMTHFEKVKEVCVEYTEEMLLPFFAKEEEINHVRDVIAADICSDVRFREFVGEINPDEKKEVIREKFNTFLAFELLWSAW